MKNFTINQLLIVVIALFSGGNALAADQVCNQFDYFYADITTPDGVKQTDIYSVSFVGTDAILNAISEDIPYGAHIAYNDIEKLLYVVNEDDGSIQTLDPHTNDWSTVIAPDMALSHITGASISPDGKLLLGSQHDGTIYQANFSTDPYTVSVYEPGNDISGGDLVYTNTGLFLASKPAGYFYVVLPGLPNILLGQVDGKVTGLAKAEDGETVMLSALGNTSFLQYDISGGVNQINEYNAFLNGEPFTLGNGDMASGCSSSSTHIDECTDFRYYYIAMGTPGVATGTVFEGKIVGSDFVLTELFNAGNKGHIANSETNGDIYVVHGNGTNIKTFDINGNHLHTASISGLGDGAVALVWHKADGKLYVGNRNTNKVYTLDPATGDLTLYADNLPVNGGDLISTDDGKLLLVERKDNGPSKVHDISSGSAIYLYDVAKSINGAALTSSGGYIMAEGSNSYKFHTYDADGVPLEVLNSVDGDGNPFRIHDGDMASGCISHEPVIEECADFRYYYIASLTPGVSNGIVFQGEIIGNDFVMTELFDSEVGGHMAINEINGDIYVVHPNGTLIKTFDVNGNHLLTTPITGLSNAVALVWHRPDGKLYVGNQNNKKVYTVDPVSGDLDLFASNVPVAGGDLISTNDGELHLVSRKNNGNSKVYDITTGVANYLYDVAKSINGAAITPSGGSLMAEGSGSYNFHLYDSDGALLQVLNSVDNNGNPFRIFDGDMASGCISSESGEEPGCNAYSMFYTNFKNQSKSEIYRLDLNDDNTLSKSLLATLNFGSVSSAVSHDGLLYISSRFGNGYFIVLDATSGAQIGGNIPMTDEANNNIQQVGGSVFHNGLLYVTSLDGMIYALNPTTGHAVETLTGIPGQGSDILFDKNEDLWIIDRPAGIFHNLTQGTSFSTPLIEIDGIALLANGNFAAANGDFNSLIYEINPAAGELTGVSFETGITMRWGDLSGVCFDPLDSDIPEPGVCYATEVIEYIQGVKKNNGPIDNNRIDPNEALGMPERTDELVFVSLGYGGSLTLSFGGAVPNLEGNDLEIVETTWGNTTCSSHPEFADVYVSVDGIDWHYAKTVCKLDPFVDISDAGDFDHIYFVKIENNDAMTTTIDGFDVDGVVALHNCEGVVEEDLEDGGTSPFAIKVNPQTSLSVYPNPTKSTTSIQFVPNTNTVTTVEVLDMSGRVVKTLLNEKVRAGETYKLNFDGSGLPNGVYIARFNDGENVVFNKIMIAK